MSRRHRDEAVEALATASASLVEPHDIPGTLASMLTGVRSALNVEACGIVIAGSSGRFEVLSASSHTAEDLTLFECQTESGPGVEACTHNQHVAVSGIDAVTARWPALAEAMGDAEYRSVLACPLRWDGSPLGAAVVMRAGDEPFSGGDQVTLQAFADLAMLVVMHTDQHSTRSAVQKVEEALESRILIEQAKGVLAHTFRIGQAEAYELLQKIAQDAGLPLTAGAHQVIAEAMGR